MIALVITFDQFFFPGRLGQRRQPISVKRVDSFCAAQRKINAFGRPGDLLQQAFVQVRFNDVAFFVAQVIDSSLGILDSQNFAFHRADADGENSQAGLSRLFRRFQCARIMIFAVGEQNQDLVVIAFLESGQRGLDCFCQSGPSLGNDIHIQRLDALTEGSVIDGEGTLQKGAACECHQAQPVGFCLLHQVERGQLRACQPIGRDVLGQHALGSINGHDNIQPALFDFFPIKAPLWPCQGQQQRDHCQNQTGQPDFLAAGGDANGQGRKQARLDELRHQPLACAPGPPKECQQRRRQDQQEPEHL